MAKTTNKPKKNDVSNDEKIKEWFTQNQSTEATKQTYTVFLQLFSDCVGKTPTEIISEAITEIKQGLMPAERKNKIYFAKFKECMDKKGYAPKSYTLGLNAVKSFFKANDIALSASINEKRGKKSLPLKENMNFITKDMIKNMLVNAKSIRDKAIFLVMATSGMARNEIRNLKVVDIEFNDDDNVSTITVRRGKTQVDYFTFISPEATIALKNYWDERNRYETTKIKSPDDYAFVTHATSYRSHGNQIQKETFIGLFSDLGKELGYGGKEKGDRGKATSHKLRKYFTSTYENAGMSKDKVDFLAGHQDKAIDLAYFIREKKTLRDLYIRYLPFITFEKTIEVKTADLKLIEELKIKHNQEIEAIKNAQKTQISTTTTAQTELEQLKAQMKEQQEQFNKQMEAQKQAQQEQFNEIMKQINMTPEQKIQQKEDNMKKLSTKLKPEISKENPENPPIPII